MFTHRAIDTKISTQLRIITWFLKCCEFYFTVWILWKGGTNVKERVKRTNRKEFKTVIINIYNKIGNYLKTPKFLEIKNMIIDNVKAQWINLIEKWTKLKIKYWLEDLVEELTY